MKYSTLILLCWVMAISCKKNNDEPRGGTALNIVNAMVGTTSLIGNFDNSQPLKDYYFAAVNSINYGSWFEFPGYSGNTPISFVDLLDTSRIVFKTNLNLPANSTHSLYLTGTSDHPDTLLTTDLIPYYSPTDSVSGVRFVNLSSDSKPVSVNLQGIDKGSEVASLSYKQVSSFKRYAVTTTLPSGDQYIFEIRDVADGNLLTTCAFNTFNGLQRTVFKNVTIVIYGLENGNGNNPVSAFVMNNY